MSGNFTVLSSEQEQRLKRLELFYQTLLMAVNKPDLDVLEIYDVLVESIKEVDPTAVEFEDDPNWHKGQPTWGAGHGGEG